MVRWSVWEDGVGVRVVWVCENGEGVSMVRVMRLCEGV